MADLHPRPPDLRTAAGALMVAGMTRLHEEGDVQRESLVTAFLARPSASSSGGGEGDEDGDEAWRQRCLGATYHDPKSVC